MIDTRGFTLVEVMVAISIATVVGATCYVLIDSGLQMHERGTDLAQSSNGLARATSMLRADVARSTSIHYAGADSLVLEWADGIDVEWAARATPTGLDVFRSIDDGSGFSERPKLVITKLGSTESLAASLNFVLEPNGIVRAHFLHGNRNLSIEAAPWGAQ